MPADRGPVSKEPFFFFLTKELQNFFPGERLIGKPFFIIWQNNSEGIEKSIELKHHFFFKNVIMRFNDGEISSTWKKNLSLDFFDTKFWIIIFVGGQMKRKFEKRLLMKKGFLWKKLK